jgi:hypothetical protein
MDTVETTADKRHAVELIGQLDGSQLAAVVHLLEVMVDPVAHSLANAPFEDEDITPELAAELDLARDGEGVAHDEVLRHYNLNSR